MEVQLVKRALLHEVLARRLHRAADIEALFAAQLAAVEAPEHKYWAIAARLSGVGPLARELGAQ